jgi:hypothetical protein
MNNNSGKQSHFGLHHSKTFWISLLLLCAFSSMVFRAMVHDTAEDRTEYLRLMSQADPSVLGSSALTPYSVAQNRRGIQKDYFYSQGPERLHICLNSESATLMMQQGPEGSVLIEMMKNVECQMQDELYYLLQDGREAIKLNDGQLTLRHSKSEQSRSLTPEEVLGAQPMQNIHQLKAKEASFHYQSGQFSGKDVQITHYSTSGHEIPTNTAIPSTALKGTAEAIEFSLTDGKPNFKATGFRAQISTAGRN